MTTAHTCGWVTTRPLRIQAAGSQHGRCAYMRLGHSTVAAHTCGWTTLTTAHTCGWVTIQSLRIHAAGLALSRACCALTRWLRSHALVALSRACCALTRLLRSHALVALSHACALTRLPLSRCSPLSRAPALTRLRSHAACALTRLCSHALSLGALQICREASEVGWSVSSVDRSSPLAARCRSIGRRLSPGCVTTADARGAIIIRERQYSALKACLIPSCYVMAFTMASWHLPPQARAAPQSVPPRTRSERAAPRRTPAARGARARERRARSNGPIALF